MDNAILRQETLRYERSLHRRFQRHANETEAVDKQVEIVAAQQAELVSVQAAADETQSQVKEHRVTIVTLAARQASFAAERALADEAAIVAPAPSPSGGSQYHQKMRC